MIDLILVSVAAEFFFFRSLLTRANQQKFITPLFLFLVSGGFLLIAVRLALSGVSGALIYVTLLFAFGAHLATLIVAATRFAPGTANP